MEESAAYQVLFLYFAMSVFQFLDGTVIKEGVADLWERFLRSVPAAQRARLGRLSAQVLRRAARDEGLPRLRRAARYDRLLSRQQSAHAGRLQRRCWASGKVHEFDPYTLLMYRGGLYVVGRSHRRGAIITLAVERMRHVERLPDTFEYPEGYSPEKHSRGHLRHHRRAADARRAADQGRADARVSGIAPHPSRPSSSARGATAARCSA